MATMKLSYRDFVTGDPIPDTPSATVSLAGGSSETLDAPYELDAAGHTYAFIFWNVDATVTPLQLKGGKPNLDQTVTFTAPSDTSTFDGTAWYIETGGGGGGSAGGSVWAFSLNKDERLTNSPIGTINPAAAKTGPNSFSTTSSSSPVVVTAPKLIGGDGLFKSWLQYEGDGSVGGATLTVPADGSTASIAFFGIPVPDPCETIRVELENLSPGDFPNPAAYRAAVRALSAELHACEVKYGELPPTP
jgi:hypothetical protein